MNFGPESERSHSSNAPPPLAALSSGLPAAAAKVAGKMASGRGGGGGWREYTSSLPGHQVRFLLLLPLLLLLLQPPLPQLLWEMRSSFGAQTSVNSNNLNINNRQQAQQAATGSDATSAAASVTVAEAARLKSTSISELLQNYANKPATVKQTLKEKALLGVIRSSGSVGGSGSDIESTYKCAKHCTCSVIQVLDRASNEHKANLTQASCESPLFADVLTIDRRTQIIHISLPMEPEVEPASSQQDSSSGASGQDDEADNQHQHQQQQPVAFRMPRLVQFDILREIVIINLKLEVCDSEVFKRGQRLRRFQLNQNQLRRISKVCLRHLEKLIELNLDHNELAELESALFSSLLSLRSLSIAHNRLSELAAHQFSNLTNLVSLNLVGNSFKTINLHLFEPMQSSLRLLLLAKNQIKSFVYAPVQSQLQPLLATSGGGRSSQLFASTGALNNITSAGSTGQSTAPFAGVIFKHLIKLNVDQNRLERIRLLQLHRFFNVKFLSIRQNNLATIRDKAFNGLKLIELNLAHNQLQTVSKCAFCNATIRRLVLSHNNITIPMPSSMLLEPAPPVVPRPLAVSTSSANDSGSSSISYSLALTSSPELPAAVAAAAQPAATSSQNMLILSQSIFGPLFGQLEYLDLSYNQRLAEQLEYLLEPLLKLEYLNLAAVGLDRSLPSPTLFKNLRQLRYLNLSHNQLDQLIAETVEPLGQLEALDLSDNKFSELDESFLVTIDDLTSLKLINLASNPWYCSQCKVAPLYDWILRSPIYNQTCIAPAYESNQAPAEVSGGGGSSVDDQVTESDYFNHQQHDYSLLVGDDDKLEAALDFDLVLGGGSRGSDDDLQVNTYQAAANDHYMSSQLPALSFRELGSSEDDPSIAETIATVSASAGGASSPVHYNPLDYCLKCEFPHELHTYNIHDLSPADFKFCAGAAPRFAASEPKIGLTLAIVIIGALFCIIVVVIVMYRRKSNTYYTNEDTDQLNATSGSGGVPGKKQMMSISSDVEHQYDATDYSSPPMSQSYESYDEDEEDEEEDEDEEEYDEEDEEDEEQPHEEEEDQVAVEDLGTEETDSAKVDELKEISGTEQVLTGSVSGAGEKNTPAEQAASGEFAERRQQVAGRYARAESRVARQGSQSLKSGSSPLAESSVARQSPTTSGNGGAGNSSRGQRRQVSSQSSAQQVAATTASESLKAHWADVGSANSSLAHTEPPPARHSARQQSRAAREEGVAPKGLRSSLSTGSGPPSSVKSGVAAAAAIGKRASKEGTTVEFGSTSGTALPPPPPPQEQRPEEQPRERLSLGRSLASRKRAAPENSQTLYHLASGLRPQGNVSGSTRSQSSAGSTGGNGGVGQRPAPLGARRPNFSQIGRRRPRASQEAAADSSVAATTAAATADHSEPEVALQEASRRGELQQMAHLAHVSHSPSALSDATTADSLALEPLDYVADGLGDQVELDDGDVEDEDDELDDRAPSGGVLELDCSSLEPELELELQRHLLHLQPSLAGGRQQQQNQPGSTHSALTQTGSRDE